MAAARKGRPTPATRKADAAARAAAAGLRLEENADGYRLVDSATGTQAAAVWTNPDGYGLTLAQVEAILTPG